MKHLKYYLMAFAVTTLLNACSYEDVVPGKPAMNFTLAPATAACFGDSLPFTVNASDAEVALSTLKAHLYFGEEKVSETTIRTKDSGKDYSGKIFIPFLANIPNGTATLKFILQNVNFTTTEEEVEVALTRPDFPYLTLVTEGQEYRMERVSANQYEVTDDFDTEVTGYIRAPKVGNNGNEMTFGWNNNSVEQGTTTGIPFTYAYPCSYTISFNTLTYAAAPFLRLLLNDEELTKIDELHYTTKISLTPNDRLNFSGIVDLQVWTLPNDFTVESDGTALKFSGKAGLYEITVDFEQKTIEAEEQISIPTLDDTQMETANGVLYQLDMDLKQGELIKIEGISDLADWWIDPTFFVSSYREDAVQFVPSDGKYRIIAHTDKKYFAVEVLNEEGAIATLQSDATGAIYIIGEGIGKPSLENEVGWNTEKALCVPPVDKKIFQFIVKAGEQVNAEEINFKFYSVKGWDGEFKGTFGDNNTLTTSANSIVLVGDGNTKDDGNLYLDGSLEADAFYRFRIDLTKGLKNGVLTVDKVTDTY